MKSNDKESLKIQLESTALDSPITETGDYYSRKFRIISADTTVLAGGWKAMTIPSEVLRAAVDKVNGRFVHLSHDKDISKWLGKIEDPYFEEASTDRPAGINATVSISRQRDDVLKTGIIKAMQEGILRNGSLGFNATAVRSHPDMDIDVFYENLGKTIDGRVVQYEVTAITDVLEYSLCHIGADPYAVALSANNEKGLLDRFMNFLNVKLGIVKETENKLQENINKGDEMPENKELEAKLEALNAENNRLSEANRVLQEKIEGIEKETRRVSLSNKVSELVKTGRVAHEKQEEIISLCLSVDEKSSERIVSLYSQLASPFEQEQTEGKPLEKTSENLSAKDYDDFFNSDDGKNFLSRVRLSRESVMLKRKELVDEKIKTLKGVI